jgi:energy-coupling factor transporter ATP-binding protein EcfA2
MATAPQPAAEAAAAAHAPIGISLRHISLYLERAPLLQRSIGGGGAGAAGGAPRSGLRILSDITGEVPAGALFLIIGGSGSGKTSLLNALALRLGSVGYRLTGAPLGMLESGCVPPLRPRRAPAASATRCRVGNGSLDPALESRWRNLAGRSLCAGSVSSAAPAQSCASAQACGFGRGRARARHATHVAAQPAHVGCQLQEEPLRS